MGASRSVRQLVAISLPFAADGIPRGHGGRIGPPLGAVLVAAPAIDIAGVAANGPSTDRSQVASQAVERPISHLGHVVGLAWRADVTA